MSNHDIQTIRNEFNRSDEARYIHRLHGVLLVLNGLSSVKAAEILGEPQRTVAEWVKRFREGGLGALGITETRGRPKILNEDEELALRKAITRSPEKSGFIAKRWTGDLVSQFLKKQFGVEMTVRNSRSLLRSLESKAPTEH